MLYMKWTGLGCLSPILLIAILCASLGGGYILTRGDITPTPGVLLLIGAGAMVLLSPLHWLLGLALNSKEMPAGRQWHNEHTLSGMPVQYGFAPQLLFALVCASGGLGLLTSPLYGWLLFGGVPIVTVVGAAVWWRQVSARPPRH